MTKANKKAQCEPHKSDTVPPEEETNFTQVSDSEQEETNFPQMSDSEPESVHKTTQTLHNYICTLHRRS